MSSDHGDPPSEYHHHPAEPRGRLRTFLHRADHLVPISHHHTDSETTSAFETHERGIWATKVRLAGLGTTAVLQLAILALTGSVALLADTAHNFTDAATSIPLWVAFVLGRRGTSAHYSFGHGRLEEPRRSSW